MAKYSGVYKRAGANTYYFKITLPDSADGQQHFLTRGKFATAKEAADARRAEQQRISGGNFANPGRQTVGEYLQRWADDLRVAESTKATYRLQVRAHLIPRLGRILLRDLAPAHIKEMYRQLETERNMSGTTLSIVHRVLHTALQAGVIEGLLASNAAARIANKPRKSTRRMKTWTLEEAQHFAAMAGGHYCYGAWMMMLAASTRRGEALGIQWSDVNLVGAQIALQGARVATPDGKVYLSEGKTEGARRTIHLDQDLIDILAAQRIRQANWKL